MKSKILILLGVVLFFIICGVGLYNIENYNEIYYTRVDNTKVEKLSTNDTMKYEYTLDCYNKRVFKKVLKFKTSRKLRDRAYLSLEVRVLGVYKWVEVDFNELTNKVKEKLK